MCKLCFFLDLVRGSLSVVRFVTRHIQSATVYNSSARQLLASCFDYLRGYFKGTAPETGVLVFLGTLIYLLRPTLVLS